MATMQASPAALREGRRALSLCAARLAAAQTTTARASVAAGHALPQAAGLQVADLGREVVSALAAVQLSWERLATALSDVAAGLHAQDAGMVRPR